MRNDAQIGNATLHNADSMDFLRSMPDCSVHAVITDPPYGLGLMGHAWDKSGIAFNARFWAEVNRVLVPGGHLLAFGGSRTYHRMACAIEDAGFDIRDQIMWLYGSGFPKSLDASKAIDKAAGLERRIVGKKSGRAGQPQPNIGSGNMIGVGKARVDCSAITAPASDEAARWEGWGTALKPAHEPICMARKPFPATVAENLLLHGAGAINIDGCRIGGNEAQPGRWPANLCHDGSPDVVALFPDNAGAFAPVGGTEPSNATKSTYGQINRMAANAFHGDSGSAARFFYCAKPSPAERRAGLVNPGPVFAHGSTLRHAENIATTQHGNHHPTVKPLALMRHLIRMVTPPGSTILDPFMGSGTTGVAAIVELAGYQFIGIEAHDAYFKIAQRRIDWAIQQAQIMAACGSQPDLFDEAAA